ncbi:MAG: S53 family serine peptidase [Ktedonobacterales bacterium]
MIGHVARGRGRPLSIVAALAALALVAGIVVGHGMVTGRSTAAHSASASPLAIRRLGPTDPARTLHIGLVLEGRAPGALDQIVAQIADPASPGFRRFLSPAELVRRFGVLPGTQTRVAGVLTAAGLRIEGRAPDGMLLRASGTVMQMEHLFGVQIDDFQTADGRRFFAATAAPHLSPAFGGAVKGVLGLESYIAAHSTIQPRRATAQVGYSPADLARAYAVAPLRQAGLDGANQTIAFAEIDTFKQHDIDAYDRAFGITAAPVEVVQVGAGAAPADHVSETTLDIEVAHAIAPGAHLIAYEGGSDTSSLAQLFDQIVMEHRAQVMSVSLGLCERYILDSSSAPQDLQGGLTMAGQSFFSALDTTFREADALGMSILVATGDSGAYGCTRFDPADHALSPSAPSTSPYVTAVGGTALFSTADGSYDREYGWEGPLEGAGSGGGLSLQYPRPTWQAGPGVLNQYSNGMRQVPDVAADADPLTGYAVYDSTRRCTGQSCWGVVGGTSAAAPLWAGLIALANQDGAMHGKHPLGFLNPALYTLGTSPSGPSPFHDVASGGNLYYPATPGWDFSTGWGSPIGNTLVQQLVALG